MLSFSDSIGRSPTPSHAVQMLGLALIVAGGVIVGKTLYLRIRELAESVGRVSAYQDKVTDYYEDRETVIQAFSNLAALAKDCNSVSPSLKEEMERLRAGAEKMGARSVELATEGSNLLGEIDTALRNIEVDWMLCVFSPPLIIGGIVVAAHGFKNWKAELRLKKEKDTDSSVSG